MCHPPQIPLLPLHIQGSADPHQFARHSNYSNGSRNDVRIKLDGGPQESDEVRSGRWPQVMAASRPENVDTASQFSGDYNGSWQKFNNNQHGLALDAPGRQFQETQIYPKLSLKRTWSNFQPSESDVAQLCRPREDGTPERHLSRQASSSVPGAPSHPNCVPANAIHSTSRLLVAPPVLSEGTWRPANIPGQVAYSAMTSQYSQTEQDSADTKFPLQAFTWLPYHSALQHREASDEIPSQEGPEVTDNDFREGGDGALTMKRIRRTLSNRESAKRSRQRRQERLKELEYITVVMRAELASARQQYEAAYQQATKYKLENEALHLEIQRLRFEMRDSESGKINFLDSPNSLPNIAKTSTTNESPPPFESDSTFGGQRLHLPKKEASIDAPSSISSQEKKTLPFLSDESRVWTNFGLHGGIVPSRILSAGAETSVDDMGGEGYGEEDLWFHDLVLGLADP